MHAAVQLSIAAAILGAGIAGAALYVCMSIRVAVCLADFLGAETLRD